LAEEEAEEEAEGAALEVAVAPFSVPVFALPQFRLSLALLHSSAAQAAAPAIAAGQATKTVVQASPIKRLRS